jgi:hypothetical protein
VRWVRNFVLFWVDFIVGDDYWVAAGIVAVLGLCAALSRTSVPAWWLAPLGILGVLALSVGRAALRARRQQRAAALSAEPAGPVEAVASPR